MIFTGLYLLNTCVLINSVFIISTHTLYDFFFFQCRYTKSSIQNQCDRKELLFFSVEVCGHWRKWSCKVVTSKANWHWENSRSWINFIRPVGRRWRMNLILKRFLVLGRLLMMLEWWLQAMLWKFMVFHLYLEMRNYFDFFMWLCSNREIDVMVCILIVNIHLEMRWDHMGVDWKFGVCCWYFISCYV